MNPPNLSESRFRHSALTKRHVRCHWDLQSVNGDYPEMRK